MKGLIKLVLFLAVAYVAVVFGKPWLEKMAGGDFGLGEMGGTDLGTAQRCVAMVERANQDFSDRLQRVISPQLNAEAWPTVHEATRNRLDKARNECGCFELGSNDDREGCQSAQEALEALERMVSDFDRAIREKRDLGNPARRQQEINAHLDRARRLVPKSR